MADDGLGADRIAGDNVWTASFTTSDVFSQMTDARVFRPFMGFVKIPGHVTLNAFAEVWTPTIGLVAVDQLDAGAQASEHVLNLAVDRDQLRGFDPMFGAKELFRRYHDRFDFINFVLLGARPGPRYHESVSSDVSGIGLDRFDLSEELGSSGRLKGLNVFPISNLFDGATRSYSHELGHQWINFLSGSGLRAGTHWPKGNLATNVMGYSIAGGAGGVYAHSFSQSSSGQVLVGPADRMASGRFNSLELYLMGMAPPSSVSGYFVLRDQNRELSSGDVLSLSDVQPVTIDHVIAANGRREPTADDGQRECRVGTVVLSETLLEPHAMAFFDLFARRASLTGVTDCADGLDTGQCWPWYVATGGRSVVVTSMKGARIGEDAVEPGALLFHGASIGSLEGRSLDVIPAAETTAWTVRASAPWIRLSQASGTGNGRVVVSIDGAAAVGGATQLRGAVTITWNLSSPKESSVPVMLSLEPLPGTPTNVRGIAEDSAALVAFDGPAVTDGETIRAFEVVTFPGGGISTGLGSPIKVPGLVNGRSYTFAVRAISDSGVGPLSAASGEVVPQAPPTLSAAPVILRFAAVKHGTDGALAVVTGGQSVTVTFTGPLAPQWTATSSEPWAVVSNGSGTGAGTFTVSIANPSNVIGGATSRSAIITLSAPNTGASTSIAVALAVTQQTGTTTVPVGQVDTPAQNATGVQGAIAMTGWVVDDIGVQRVRIYRQCLSFDAPAACQPVLGHSLVFVGDASVISGARPDVEAQYPNNPANTSAGWGFLILSNLLPNIPAGTAGGGGVGAFTFYAIATDQEGNEKLLGRTINDSTPTTVTVANDTIAKPFGAIDTPGQGATVSGTLNNFGWTLTPDSNTVADGTDILVPTTGATINVVVDGASVGTATFNLCRGSVGNPVPASALCDDDVSSIFRSGNRYRNLDAGRGPIALRSIDTRTLTNGLHTIQWGVSDSAGRGEGIGSRYFTVLNSSADTAARQAAEPATRPATDGNLTPVADLEIYGRTGFDLQRALVPVERINGVSTIRVPEMGRVELQIPGAQRVSLLANSELREAPVGMAVHGADTVAWSVGPGYLGTYRLRVDRVEDHVLVDVRVVPMTVAEEPTRMHLDRADVFGAEVVLHGWAFDPQAETGAGIGAVHVWARQRGVEDVSPVFLGEANLGIPRSDVAAAHGAPYGLSGFQWAGALAPGEWDVTAYVWNVRTARFEDARTVVIVVR